MNVPANSRHLALATLLTVASLTVVSTAYGCERKINGSPQAKAQSVSNIGCGGGGGGSVPYSDSYSWGTATGTANTNTQNLTGSDTSNATSIAASVDGTNQVYTATLPHSVIQTTYIDNNGSYELEFYIYTKSAYAPNGDSGTFLLDSNGDMLEGKEAKWSRLSAEVREADPDQVAEAQGIFGSIGS